MSYGVVTFVFNKIHQKKAKWDLVSKISTRLAQRLKWIIWATTWITHVLEVGNFWVQKKSRQNISTWDLVLKISSRLAQRWKRFLNRINGLTYKTFLNFHILYLIRMRSALLSFCDYRLKQILIRLGPAHSRAGSTLSPGMHVSTARYRSLS